MKGASKRRRIGRVGRKEEKRAEEEGVAKRRARSGRVGVGWGAETGKGCKEATTCHMCQQAGAGEGAGVGLVAGAEEGGGADEARQEVTGALACEFEFFKEVLFDGKKREGAASSAEGVRDCRRWNERWSYLACSRTIFAIIQTRSFFGIP